MNKVPPKETFFILCIWRKNWINNKNCSFAITCRTNNNRYGQCNEWPSESQIMCPNRSKMMTTAAHSVDWITSIIVDQLIFWRDIAISIDSRWTSFIKANGMDALWMWPTYKRRKILMISQHHTCVGRFWPFGNQQLLQCTPMWITIRPSDRCDALRKREPQQQHETLTSNQCCLSDEKWFVVVGWWCYTFVTFN